MSDSDNITELSEDWKKTVEDEDKARLENYHLQNYLLRKQIEIRELGIKWFKLVVETMLESGAKKQGLPKQFLEIVRDKMKKDGLL